MEPHHTPPDEKRRRSLPYLFLGVGCALLVLAYLIGISDNPPGIVAMLMGACAVIVGAFMLAGKPRKRTIGQELLYWTPRALCITCALFVAIFALDVFGEGQDFWGTILALLLHLIPTFLILLVLVISWRREWIGGVILIAIAVFYLWSVWNTRFFWTAGLLISGPLLLTGILFLLNWSRRSELRGT